MMHAPLNQITRIMFRNWCDCLLILQYGQVNHGVIVVGYSDGSPAHIHVMNRATCEQYWRDWTERLYSYYQLIYTEKMAARMGKINAKKMKMSSVGAVQ